ncbi:thioredoxin family protein [Halalkalibacter akibai]|uniref:Thioredoxin n=1 Tax=Halalkalibacter akibai (strain ATCC 43226 / DSM 21942 / CIP 109018 / JCM 9157 / 1139) TaxID=1236973 RepID=W4QS62_HALA3|nr:thioredoxin family protein [Halalkalibacter akibai]GAE34184.1 thioredoxin [Halalkalibacter akibai JCM 9157]
MEKLKSIEEFKEVSSKEAAIFMFSAGWCPDCRVIEPVLPRIEADFPSFTFYYVDRDQFIDLCAELDIFGIPSFLAYVDGKEVERFVSKDRKTQEEIEAFLTKAESHF